MKMRPRWMGIRSVWRAIATVPRRVEIVVTRRDEISRILQSQNASVFAHDGGLVRGGSVSSQRSASQQEAPQWENQRRECHGTSY